MKDTSIQRTVYFRENPRRISDLRLPHLLSKEVPYVIEHTIALPAIEYENFITDLGVERQFIQDYKASCYIDDQGLWHCILVRRRGIPGGVLVMSGGTDRPQHAAWLDGR